MLLTSLSSAQLAASWLELMQTEVIMLPRKKELSQSVSQSAGKQASKPASSLVVKYLVDKSA